MFIAAIVTVARTWTQPESPSEERMWYVHTAEYLSAIERNKTGSFVVT